MKKIAILNTYHFVYHILLLLVFCFIAKFIFDFYNKNVTIEVDNSNMVQYRNLIFKPELQFNSNGFQFFTADSGIEEKGDYIFKNIKTYGDFGKASAGQLRILENLNVLEFTQNPEFIIYDYDLSF
jgi:hypothetical protein